MDTARMLLISLAVVLVASACVPTFEEAVVLEADGSGELVVTWFARTEDIGAVGLIDEPALDTEAEVRAWAERATAKRMLTRMLGETEYILPEGAELTKVVTPNRIGVRYRQPFAHVSELETWPTLADGDPDARPSVLVLGNVAYAETDGRSFLRIDPWAAVTGLDDGGVGTRPRLQVTVSDPTATSNADRVEDDTHYWDAAGNLATLESARIQWGTVAEVEEDDSNTLTLAALGLLGVGLLIAAWQVLRRR